MKQNAELDFPDLRSLRTRSNNENDQDCRTQGTPSVSFLAGDVELRSDRASIQKRLAGSSAA
jgi:hypothetical protein